MAIKITKTISVNYSEKDIKQLIIADLRKQSVHVEPADIKVSISGGYADESWKQYSGGHSPASVEIVPVVFNGFTVLSEKSDEPPKPR